MPEKRLRILAPVVTIVLLLVLIYFMTRRSNEETPSGTGDAQTGRAKTTAKNEPDKYRRLDLKKLSERSATIRGAVTRADNGSVLRAISVSWKFPGAREPEPGAITRSNLEGTYELKPVLGQSLETLQITAKSGQWLGQTRKIKIRIGETLENVDFLMTDTTDITITLIDAEDNSPIIDAEVSLTELKTKTIFKSDLKTEHGDYLFKNIRRNYYRINASAEKYVDLITGTRVEWVNQEFQFSLGQCAGLSGRVTDTKGNPIADATVIFRMAGGMAIKTKTDEAGDYVFDRLRPNQGEIGAEHPDFAKKIDAVITVEKGEWATHDIVLAGGVGVFGTVRNLKGAPVAGAEVYMTLEYCHSVMRYAAITDKEGKYRFKNIAPSKYGFQIRARGYITKVEQHFNLQPDMGDREKNFLLDPGGTIFGRLQDSAGNPVAGVKIIAAPESGFPAGAVSDENGDFVIGGLPLDQTYRVTFTPKKDNAYLRIMGIPVNKDLGVVTLESYGSMKGTVTWGNTPLPDIKVTVWRLKDPYFKTNIFTNENGIFFNKTLRPGTYHLEISAEGFEKYEIDKIIIEEYSAVENIIIGLKQLKPR